MWITYHWQWVCQKVKTAKNFRMPQKIIKRYKRVSLVMEASESMDHVLAEGWQVYNEEITKVRERKSRHEGGEKNGCRQRKNQQQDLVQFSAVAQSCLTLLEPRNRSMPGLLVHHQLPESTQTQVHWVGDAIQPSHPLSSPSPPALPLSQHQGLFKWVSSSHEVAKVLEFQLQHQSLW